MKQLYAFALILFVSVGFSQQQIIWPFKKTLASTDSIVVEVFVDYTKEMAVNSQDIIRKPFTIKTLEDKDVKKFINVMVAKESYLDYYTNYSHQNIEFNLYQENKKIGKVIVSSISANVTFDDLNGSVETKTLSDQAGQYMIRLLKSADLLQYFYATNLVGLSRTKEKTINF